MGINGLEELLRIAGMLIEPRRKRIVTTNSRGMSRYPNRINGLEVNDINQLVVGDITYYILGEKTYYIFDLKDYYSGYIVGLTGNTNMEGYNGIVCLEQMEQLRGKEALRGLILHTDAGGQYRSTKYKQWLASRMCRTISWSIEK
jgi:transposase InsO family protein